jgi:hypothetical protein
MVLFDPVHCSFGQVRSWTAFFFVQEEEAVIRTGSSSRVETEEEFPLMSPHTTPLAKNNRAYVPVLDAPPVAEPRPAARRGRTE